jgi:hypothetical protein
MPTLRNRIFGAALPIVLAAGLVSCSDDPVAPEEHLDPAGFAIELDGTEVLRYEEGQAQNPSLALAAGTTYEAVVVFLDDDGDPLPHEEHAAGEEEETLRVDIVNGVILVWQGEEHEEGEEEEVLEFHGELTAVAVGATTFRICLLHEDHCDFESPFLNVANN